MDMKQSHANRPPLKEQAVAAATASRLPGWTRGPADAFRHIAASAEATRRYGRKAAWTLGELNEQKGTWIDKQSKDDLDMDRHNNAIGRRIGATAKSYAEIIERTKAAIDEGVAQGGSGTENASKEATPKWLPQEEWKGDTGRDRSNWPPVWKQGREGDAERVLSHPVAQWTEDDVHAVQDSKIYRRGEGAARERAFAKVRQWYEARSSGRSASNGPISVHAYTRGDGTPVAGHSRGAPHRGGATE